MTNLKTIQFQIDAQNTKLCDYLLNRYVLPILQKNTEVNNLAQGAMRHKASKLTPEQQLEAVINFGRPEKQHITIPRRTVNVAQGGFNTKELQNLERILEFGSGKK